jgi:hypothetical protein
MIVGRSSGSGSGRGLLELNGFIGVLATEVVFVLLRKKRQPRAWKTGRDMRALPSMRRLKRKLWQLDFWEKLRRKKVGVATYINRAV